MSLAGSVGCLRQKVEDEGHRVGLYVSHDGCIELMFKRGSGDELEIPYKCKVMKGKLKKVSIKRSVSLFCTFCSYSVKVCHPRIF